MTERAKRAEHSCRRGAIASSIASVSSDNRLPPSRISSSSCSIAGPPCLNRVRTNWPSDPKPPLNHG